MIYFFIKFGSLIFFKSYLGFKVYGKENIPKKGAFILAANHSSYLDPPLLAVSFKRALHFITRDKLLKAGLLGRILSYANTIPVKRHGRDMVALKKTLLLLKNGKVLVVFPEGARSKNRELKKAKKGAGFLVCKSNVPVLPVYIKGTFDAQPRGLKTLKRHPVSVHIGKAVRYGGKFVKTHKLDLYQAISDDIMKQVGLLKDSFKVKNHE